MGRYRVELDLANSPWLQAYYDYHWAAIGNLGVDILVIPLGKLLGLKWAVKAIVLAIPPLTAAGLPVGRARGARTGAAHGILRAAVHLWLSVPVRVRELHAFGRACFLAFGLWLRLGRLERTVLREWLFVPISLLVFFCHTYGWGLLGLMCFSADAVRLHDRGRTWWKAGIEAALRTSVMARAVLHHARMAKRDPRRADGRLVRLEDQMALDLFGAARPLEMVRYWRRSLSRLRWPSSTHIFSRKLTLSRNLAFSAIVLAAGFAIIPRIVFGSAYADMRLVPYLMAVGLLAIRFRGAPDRRTAQVLAVLGLLFFGTRTAANTLSLGMAGADQRAKLHAIDAMPRGARVISLNGMPCREYWPLMRNGHLGAMVIVRREGFSNDQWLLEGVNLLDLKYRAAGYYAADPSQLVRPNGCRDRLHRTIDKSLASLPRRDFDYVWLIDVPPYDPSLVEGLQPVWRGPGSVLYRLH